MPVYCVPWRMARWFVFAALGVACAASHAGALVINATGVDLDGRPVVEIKLDGIEDVPETLVRNQVRLRVGEPYDSEIAEQDIVRLTHLNRFRSIRVLVSENDEGSLTVTYQFDTLALFEDVAFSGNKSVADQQLFQAVTLRSGDPIDEFLIQRGAKRIIDVYKANGHFFTSATWDVELLKESRILLYQIREGPKVRVREIGFNGNEVFTDKQLRAQILSKTFIPLIRAAPLNQEQLDVDAGRLQEFYHAHGYLNARAGRDIQVSPDSKDAKVIFVIEEGRRYLVANITIEGNDVFPDQQIAESILLKVGDVYSRDRVERGKRAIRSMYLKLGYLDVNAAIDTQFHEADPTVDVTIRILEGIAHTVGRVTIRGNTLTKDKVILRQLRGINPGRRFDGTGVSLTRRRLAESRLFTREGTNLAILGQPGDRIRDVLVEVEETNTGSLGFGAGVSSDAGVIGAINLSQRNFDIADPPETVLELISGKAFRGAGQTMDLSLQPGNESQRYSIRFKEPYLFESNIFLGTSLFLFDRVRSDWDEGRTGGSVRLGRRFGDVWSASVSVRGEKVEIDRIDVDAPVDVFQVAGEKTLTAVGFALKRETTDSRVFPTRGNVLEMSLSRAGVLGGDFDFTKVSTSFVNFWTLDEDFFNRKTVLSIRIESGIILENNEAPVFERFYAGGHRTIRGFDFRGAGPRGRVDPDQIPNSGDEFVGTDAVGGDFLFLFSIEYNIPIYQDIMRIVFFTDTGTVDPDVDFGDYRVVVGTGLRLKIPAFGQAPLAFDVAFPILKQDGDETRAFSFDVAVPF